MKFFGETEIFQTTVTNSTGDTENLNFDPLDVYRSLMFATGGKYDELVAELPKLASQIDSFSLPPLEPGSEPGSEPVPVGELIRKYCQMEETLALAGYQALGFVQIDPSTGEGVTQSEVLRIIRDFAIWCNEKKDDTGI
jgi:hypothetical protein